jgi:hypothetical protein
MTLRKTLTRLGYRLWKKFFPAKRKAMGLINTPPTWGTIEAQLRLWFLRRYWKQNPQNRHQAVCRTFSKGRLSVVMLPARVLSSEPAIIAQYPMSKISYPVRDDQYFPKTKPFYASDQ